MQRRVGAGAAAARSTPLGRAQQAERWIEWIKGSGVDVVGDLDDLRPLPPVPDGPSGSTPTGSGPKTQLDAAVDALVAMTHEAARRPDPDRRAGRQGARRRRAGCDDR